MHSHFCVFVVCSVKEKCGVEVSTGKNFTFDDADDDY